MFNNKKIVVVMPAYNAEKTLLMTYHETMEQGCVDLVIIVDDASTDLTLAIAKTLDKTVVFRYDVNSGYGANQKKCYELAIDNGADIVVMVHPDYQYSPKLIPAMASLIANGLYECVIGSRILGGYALQGGMPIWKYMSNRFLTLFENFMIGAKLSEYHSGYRAYSRNILEKLDLKLFDDGFSFDNEILAQIIWMGGRIAEITCPTKYFTEASSINFRRCIKYGLGCLQIAITFKISRLFNFVSTLFKNSKRNVFS